MITIIQTNNNSTFSENLKPKSSSKTTFDQSLFTNEFQGHDFENSEEERLNLNNIQSTQSLSALPIHSPIIINGNAN